MLATASPVIISAPLKLPRKVVAVAQYVALAISLLDAIEEKDDEASLQLSIGTGGGTLLSLISQMGMHDVVRTVVFAALGATVSFIVTLTLQRFFRRK